MSTPEPDPPSHRRVTAMDFAVTLHRDSFDRDQGYNRDVLVTATAIDHWLTYGPTTLGLAFGPLFRQDTGQPVPTYGGFMSQLHADEHVDARVIALDSRGNEVPDDPTTTIDDVNWSLAEGGDSVITLIVDPTTSREVRLVAAGLGSTVLTAAIQTSAGERIVTHAIDVIPGEIATMEIVVGTPEKQDEDESDEEPI